jgi:hypothetical protein
LLLLVGAACTEQPTAPGACPNFCPGDSIRIHDTVFTDIIARDSSFQGYLAPYYAKAMTAADLPGIVDSRALLLTDSMSSRIAPNSGDTTTVPIVTDSVRLRLVVVRRPTNTTNLRLRVFKLPITVDSATDFATLDPYFAASAIDTVNLSQLLATPGTTDTAVVRYWRSVCAFCIDSVRVDSAGNVVLMHPDSSTLLLYLKLDSLQAPLVDADTGRLAFGFRVAADSFASIALATTDSIGNEPLLRRWYHYTIPDTVSTKPDSVVQKDRTFQNRFDSFVFNPPTPPPDSNLAVGGAPSSRALLRVTMPKFLHDTLDIVRATLILVPVSAVQGAPSDSFLIRVRPVLTDLGAKSPLSTNPALYGNVFMHTGSTDTVRIEVTSLVRSWSLDTTLATSIVLGQVPEATSYTEARFYSTRTPAFRPSLQVTYVSRFEFGKP